MDYRIALVDDGNGGMANDDAVMRRFDMLLVFAKDTADNRQCLPGGYRIARQLLQAANPAATGAQPPCVGDLRRRRSFLAQPLGTQNAHAAHHPQYANDPCEHRKRIEPQSLASLQQ